MTRTRKNNNSSIEWHLKGSYSVEFADDLFAEDNPLLSDTLRRLSGEQTPRILLVADTNVVQRTDNLGTRIGRYLQAHGIELAGASSVLGGGEKIKCDNFASFQKVLAAAIDAKIGCRGTILAIGGGTVLDVAGYVAAQLRGGARIVRVPTTPAAMIDAAYASYAALNYLSVKDALRVPCHPDAVFVDTSFAATVLDGVWRGGVGELMRIAAVTDADFARSVAAAAPALRDRDMEIFSELVREAVALRKRVGNVDFALWSSLRLEAMSGYKLPHGYAVPIGICIDCAYAVERGLMSSDEQALVCVALSKMGALDGLSHSHHLMGQIDSILCGLDAWALSSGDCAISLPKGLGKSTKEKAPDRELYRKVLAEFEQAVPA